MDVPLLSSSQHLRLIRAAYGHNRAAHLHPQDTSHHRRTYILLNCRHVPTVWATPCPRHMTCHLQHHMSL